MTKTIDALKLAEEALEGWKEYDTWTGRQMWNDDDEEALAAIREALAEQELYEPEGRCKECLAYNGHLDYCSKASPVSVEAAVLAEREACAQTVETESQDSTRYEFAAAIRARGNK